MNKLWQSAWIWWQTFRGQTFWRLGFWCCAIAVGCGSLLPGDELPPLAASDKLLHLLGHGGIAFCAALAWPRRWSLLLLVLPLYGVGLEVLQQWVPNRSFDWQDMVANAGGVLLAFAIVWCGRCWLKPATH